MATHTQIGNKNSMDVKVLEGATSLYDENGTAISNSNPLPTSAVISGDVNVDSTSISVQAYVGKPSGTNADFVTARTGATTFTCATLPSDVSAINTEDIEMIRQITTAGVVVASYSRDDKTITCSGTDPTTITVTGAVFGATDTITLYTNIYKPIEADVQIGAVEIKDGTTDARAVVSVGGEVKIEGAVTTDVETGLATSVKQDDLLTELQLKADLTETQPVSVATVPLPTGAATSAKQLADDHNVTVSNMIPSVETGLATSAKQLADGHNVVVTSAPSTVVTATDLDVRSLGETTDAIGIYGSDDGGTTMRLVKTDATGSIQVDLDVAEVTANAGTNLNTSALALEAGGNLADVATDTGVIAGDTTSIDGKITACDTGAVVVSSGTLTAVTAITNELPAGTQNIGDVDIASALPAGTNAIGKLVANSGVDIGDVDILSIAAGDNNIGNVDIVTLPDAGTDTNWFQATITSADATSATVVKAKTADKKIHIVSLIISADTEMSIQLQSDNGTPQVVMEQVYITASGGIAMAFPKEFPLRVNENEDLDVIASVAGNISITVTGYVI